MIFQRLFFLGIAIAIAECLPTGLMEDVAKADKIMRPKSKRTQEVFMFGNQQNRRVDNSASSNTFTPNNEKRTLGTSGLEDVKAALSEDEARSHFKQANPPMFDRDGLLLSPYEKNYLYGKVMVNEMGDDYPRSWDVLPYSGYYNYEEDRRKRSDKSSSKPSSTSRPTQSTTVSPLTSSATPLPATRNTPRPVSQVKRSPSAYPELRYKRALDREDLLALLTLWENSSRNRNWHNYGNDEYENIDDGGNVVGLEDDDSRAGAWLEGPVYTPRHFSLGSDVAPSDIGIPRTHPVNSYEQFNNQYEPAYESTQYGTAQYGSLYPQHSYYPPEKRFMVSRKRSQGYDSYAGRNLNDVINFSQMMNSQPQGYLNYPRMLY
ncbi:prohormone-2-like [Chelonus insularis]|uniref:prohormone-2-like n=1 Tax=Chelonus insularis TaxID=460826 RepID=UPI00158E9F2E|nr:prohormone-2-like [Chelonus insularis]